MVTALVDRPVDGHPQSVSTVAFSEPYERDGVAVITAATVRTHTADHTNPDPDRHGFGATMSGSRPAGAFVVRDGAVHWQPALDLTRLLTTAGWVFGAVLVARRLSTRPSSARANVTMGPGGWVSMKGGTTTLRPSRRAWRRQAPSGSAPRPSPRPWWARLLSAKSLQSLLRW